MDTADIDFCIELLAGECRSTLYNSVLHLVNAEYQS